MYLLACHGRCHDGCLSHIHRARTGTGQEQEQSKSRARARRGEMQVDVAVEDGDLLLQLGLQALWEMCRCGGRATGGMHGRPGRVELLPDTQWLGRQANRWWTRGGWLVGWLVGGWRWVVSGGRRAGSGGVVVV